MTSNRRQVPIRSAVVAVGLAFAAVLWVSQRTPGTAAADPAAVGAPRVQAVEVSVSARRYEYEPPLIEVTQDDLVKVVFSCEDIAHSFTVDAYRISKRAAPGQPVVFEFRADKPGRFPIYCALAIDEGCRQMRGELIVRPR